MPACLRRHLAASRCGAPKSGSTAGAAQTIRRSGHAVQLLGLSAGGGPVAVDLPVNTEGCTAPNRTLECPMTALP